MRTHSASAGRARTTKITSTVAPEDHIAKSLDCISHVARRVSDQGLCEKPPYLVQFRARCGNPARVEACSSRMQPKADLPQDLRTTSAASFLRMPPSLPRVRLVAVRRCAVLMMFKGERPHPRRALRCRVHLHDAADHLAVGKHIVVVVAPLAGQARG